MENMKFAEMKVMAKALGWVEAHEGNKKNFIGVSKQDVINFIENAQEENAKLKSMPLPEAVKELDEKAKGKPTQDNGDLITLKEISSMLGITEKSLRRKLRMSGMKKPGGRWEWNANHEDLPKIYAWKNEA